MDDEAGDAYPPASDDEAPPDDQASDDTESYEGLAPPDDEEVREADADEEPDASAAGDTAPMAVPAVPVPEPPSGWLGSTAPVGALPPPPPPRKRRRAGLAVALVVLLVGAAAGVVVALSGGSSNTPAAAPNSPSPAPSPSLVSPSSLSAHAEPFDVTLTWVQPASEPAVETYEIYRNDTLVDEVEGATTTYDDSTVTPGRKYTYKLQAKTGSLVTDPIRVRVTVPKPPLGQARLEGDFNVKLKVVSSTGFSRIDTDSTAGWQFKPKCKVGPCKVVFSDLSEKSLKTTLVRAGIKYTGEDPSVIFGTCSGKPIPSDTTIELTVTKAKGLTEEWVATRFTGSISFDPPSQFGCVRASATLSFTGNLLA